MSVIERIAHTFWMQNGVKLREHYPWDSDDPYARELREVAMSQARIALANCEGAVSDRDALAAYVCWRFAPFGEAPIAMDDLRAMLVRLGYHPAGGQS